MKQSLNSTQRAQTMVEFALALPILLLLSIMIFDFGRAVYYSSVVHNAAREGARYGIINPDDDTGMINRAEEYAIGLGLSDLEVVAGAGPIQDVGGYLNYTVEVTVTYTFKPATPFATQILALEDDNLPIVGEAIMRTETKPSD